MERHPKYRVGQKFNDYGTDYTVTDIHRTYNLTGHLIKLSYLVSFINKANEEAFEEVSEIFINLALTRDSRIMIDV